MQKGSKHTLASKEKIHNSLLGNIPWNKGKKGLYYPTEETRRKQSESLKGHAPWSKGRHHSEETKKKMRGYIPWNKSKPWSAEMKKKMSDGQTPELRERLRQRQLGTHPSEETIKKQRAKRLLRVFPKKDTLPERLIQLELAYREIGCYRNAVVGGVCQPDFAWPDEKIAVFADGDYWHCLPRIIEKDARQNKLLRTQGWLILRYWEHEIKANPIGVVDEIIDILFKTRGEVYPI